MSEADQINRELARLDAERVRLRIDEPTFRAARRQLLLKFEQRQDPTASDASAGKGESQTERPERQRLSSPSTAKTPPARGIDLKLATVIVVASIILSLLWMNLPRDEAPPTPELISPEPAPDLPQHAATALIESDWSGGDIADFLRRWHQLPPEAIHAAEDDPRIWLLRGETEQRLGTARAARSLGDSAEADTRIRQLETLQRVIRAP